MRKKSELIIITKECKQCNNIFHYTKSISNNTIERFFCCKSCATKYNYKNMKSDDKIKRIKKINSTNFEKYGDKWVVNSKYSRNKCKEKTGFEYSLQSNLIQKKCNESLFKNTGYTSPAQNPKTLEKILKTKIERYGDYLIPMSKYKDYKMPSGKIVKIQGNENYGINILLNQYSENDIIIGRKNIESEIGKIYYYGIDNKSHIYYPDIYVKSQNKIFEVKSNFTYQLHKETNELKKQAIINKNIAFEFMIID